LATDKPAQPLQKELKNHNMPIVETNQIEPHSNEIEEIISSKPPLIVRWGTVYFFILLLLIIVFCQFISYPDIVNAKAKLTSINAPKEVKIKTEGKLVKLNAVEGKFVQQGQLLGFMESRADHDEVIMLAKIVDSLQSLMQNNGTENISAYLSGSFEHLGEVQQNFQTFMQSFNLFRQYLLSGYYLQKKKMLHGDIDYLVKLHSNLLQQKTMQEEDLGLAQKNLDANKSLNEDKVISAFDYRNERSKYIGKALSIPQIESAVISNESNQHEKQKEILQLENDIAQQKEIFSQSLNTLKAILDDWKSKYVLIAPVDGKAAAFQHQDLVTLGQHVGEGGFPGAMAVGDVDVGVTRGVEHAGDVAQQAVGQRQQRARIDVDGWAVHRPQHLVRHRRRPGYCQKFAPRTHTHVLPPRCEGDISTGRSAIWRILPRGKH